MVLPTTRAEGRGEHASRAPRRAGRGLLWACIAGAATAALADALPRGEPVASGAGMYYRAQAQPTSPVDHVPPPATFRSGAAARVAAPTNQWYSSLMFERWSHPLYAQPMTYQAGAGGFEIGRPAGRLTVEPGGIKRDVGFLHAAAIRVRPLAFTPLDARLSRFSDWLAEVRMSAADESALTATILHGSPFSYFECSRGDVQFDLSGSPRVLWNPADAGRDPRVAAFTLDGRSYAIFAPTGARWDWSQAEAPVLRLPANARYFSIAGLPDDRDATVRDFLDVAYAFPTETRAEWSFDEQASRVRTTFRVETVAREGRNLTTFMGLYPHHWSAIAPRPASKYEYTSVRGAIRLIAANHFTVERTYHGFVPFWGGVRDPTSLLAIDASLGADLAQAGAQAATWRGTYWVGKRLGALAQLAAVAGAQDRSAARDALLDQLKALMEAWFDGRHAGYFIEDARLGTFVAIPQEYNSVQSINDHHFHYGYWITAAAHVALRDREWIAASRWGGLVGKIVADIATAERGRRDFPYLRHFDAYEGHSWASGLAMLDAGNDEESSSEAVNAWAGLILLGEATGNRRLRDLGVYLYTSEIAAIGQYWFDLDHQVLMPGFGEDFVSLLFGGKYAYGTWWTAEPRQIAGINAVPLTPASTYLGADPDFVRRIIGALPEKQRAYYANGSTDGTPRDIWQDIIAAYLALADADAARALWNRDGSIEAGETRTHTLYWLESLKEMGRPDFSVTANTTLYAVFRDAHGMRTHLAYNTHPTRLRVTFSDGAILDVAPHSLAREPVEIR